VAGACRRAVDERHAHPRTLYLALTGARDLSVIESPPADRHPIQTIVKTYDEALVVEGHPPRDPPGRPGLLPAQPRP